MATAVFKPIDGPGLNPYTPDTGTASAATPPPVAPAAPADKITTFGGYTPDYAGLIKADPGYLSAQTAAQEAQATAAAQRRAALRTAIIRYGGGLPANFSDKYGDIDQATLDAAQGNQQSTLANLARNYQQSEQQFLRQLAARGALQSGDLNYGEDQLQHGYAQQQYDAANSVGDTASGALDQYTGVLNQNARDLAAGVSTAEANVSANPAYKPQPASYANYDATNSSKYGQPLYTDPTGALYTADGSVFTPGSGGSGGASGAPAPTSAPAAAPADTYDPNAYYQYNPSTGQVITQQGRPAANTGLWMQ